MSRPASQLRLGLKKRPTHGGARKGVTLRVLPHVWNLRSERSMRVIETALEGARQWREFRVVHFSVQGEHLHLVVEADDNRALSEGMQGLSVRLAKGLNRMMSRHGKVFADRFHSHVLASPAEVRNSTGWRRRGLLSTNEIPALAT